MTHRLLRRPLRLLAGWSCVVLIAFSPSNYSILALSSVQPAQKNRVAVLGAGGYTGGLAFGFLQRCMSLYNTGIGKPSTIGSTADTSLQLNRILSRHFALAMADESYIDLVDISDIDMIQARLSKVDALILGNDLRIKPRTVTLGTYEKSPNDKCVEIYYDMTNCNHEEYQQERRDIVSKVIEACGKAHLQHVCAIDTSADHWLHRMLQDNQDSLTHTCIMPPSGSSLTSIPSYSYRKGIKHRWTVAAWDPEQATTFTAPIPVEELVALSVQCLQSLDWNKSRALQVAVQEPASAGIPETTKRPDQEWAVRSEALEQALRGVA